MKNPLSACMALLLAMAGALSCTGNQAVRPDPHSEAELSGLRVAVTSGGCYDLDLSARKDIRLCRFSSEANIIEALVNGKADVAIHDETVFDLNTRRRMGIRIAFKGEKSFPTGFGFRKDRQDLADTCDALLAEMQANGTLDSLCAFWLNENGVDTGSLVPYRQEGTGEPLRVATGCTMAPITFPVENDWYGLECDILYRLGRRLGRPVEIKYYEAGSGMMAVQTGAADVMCGCVFITPERAQKFSFSKPYHYFHSACYVHDGSARSAGFGQTLKKALHQTFVHENRWKYLLSGLGVTLEVTLLSILAGALLGAGICALSRSRRKGLRKIAALYNGFMEGIPMVVLLLLMFYVVLAHSGMGTVGVAVVTFSLYFASASSGVYRAALNGVPRGQTEAGLALGFTRSQTFFRIVFPQAVQIGLPAFKGQCVSLLKGTSIVGYIALMDLTRAGDLIRNRTFDAILPLLTVTVLYFLLAWMIGALVQLAANKKRAL